MTYIALIAVLAVAVLAGEAMAQGRGYPVGGFGDAWMQDQPSSVGIDNGYDAQNQTYLVPGNPPYRVPANPAYQGRSAARPR